MRLLVIEDEKKIREMLETNFRAENFAVDVCDEGERGNRLARLYDYDAIVLDHMLPRKNGIDICRDIRAHGKSTPILALSIKSHPLEKIELLNAGADDCLAKPFLFEELLARIRALLRRPCQMIGDILTIGDIVLNSTCGIVYKGKKEVYLTKKEFGLLEYLMRHPGIVVSRSMMMEHVWDMNADPFSNTIESHIRSLRKKVDANPKMKLIHTVPGRGYKIQE